jgi:hypothetical protein
LVSAANATARALGVLPGMTATQAKSIAGSLQKSSANPGDANPSVADPGDWSWIEHDTQEDLEEIYALAERLMQFSPLVGVESIDKTLWAGRSILQPQSICIDITGLESWYGGEMAMAQELQRWLTAEGRFGCIGIADSLGQAWAVSNYAFRKQVSTWMLQIERNESSLSGSLQQNPRVERIASGATWEAFRNSTRYRNGGQAPSIGDSNHRFACMLATAISDLALWKPVARAYRSMLKRSP